MHLLRVQSATAAGTGWQGHDAVSTLDQLLKRIERAVRGEFIEERV
jgi:hypothetical protein